MQYVKWLSIYIQSICYGKYVSVAHLFLVPVQKLVRNSLGLGGNRPFSLWKVSDIILTKARHIINGLFAIFATHSSRTGFTCTWLALYVSTFQGVLSGINPMEY